MFRFFTVTSCKASAFGVIGFLSYDFKETVLPFGTELTILKSQVHSVYSLSTTHISQSVGVKNGLFQNFEQSFFLQTVSFLTACYPYWNHSVDNKN